MSFQRLQPGEILETISAGTWNALVDDLVSRVGPRPDRAMRPTANGPANVVRVRNDTGATLRPYHIVGISTPPVTMAKPMTPASFFVPLLMKATTPTIDDIDRFGVCAPTHWRRQNGHGRVVGIGPGQT